MRLIIYLLCLISLNLNAQNDCENDYKFLVNKIKNDYPGYEIKSNKELKKIESETLSKVRNKPDSCFDYLQEYTSFFKDRHLRISEVKDNSEQLTKSDISTFGSNIKTNIDSLVLSNYSFSSIEGIWKSFDEEIIIIKENNFYLGIVINKNEWKNGQVAYKIIKNIDGSFSSEIFNLYGKQDLKSVNTILSVNENILEIENYKYFVRETNDKNLDKITLYSYIPTKSNEINVFPLALGITDSTFYLRVPDFFTNSSNDLVKKHYSEITKRPNLIIDLRGNVGGQDEYYQELMKLINSNPYLVKGVEWYASKGNIDVFEKTLETKQYKNGDDGKKWIEVLLSKMKKNKGNFVTHPYDENKNELINADTVLFFPKRIGIIICEDNASAAEQFLLAAKQSKKVILFGSKNTAGVLDYSNIVAIDFPSNKYILYNPMTRSKRLPDNPIDNIGISPDIIIPYKENNRLLFDRIDDWVYFVKNYLEFIK